MTTTVLDALLASAVDLARAAALEDAPAEHVGEHVEVSAVDELVVLHLFECLDRAYVGWRWAVSLTRVPDSDLITVDEVVLLPGPTALLAPPWVPWDERVRAGDLSPGDLHPTDPDDPRLEPGFSGADALEAGDETSSDIEPLRPEQWELGLGRETVLSPYGRGIAADRWWDGEFGPDSPMAKAAPGACRTCGFLLPMGGLLGQAFGVCANEIGADGRVVALGYGCGAHSSVRQIEGTGVPVTEIAVDDERLDVIDLREPVQDAMLAADVPEPDAVEPTGPADESVLPEADAEPERDHDASDVEDEQADDADVEDSDVEDSDLEDEDEDEDDEDDEDEDDEDEDEDDEPASTDVLADVEDIEPDEVLG